MTPDEFIELKDTADKNIRVKKVINVKLLIDELNDLTTELIKISNSNYDEDKFKNKLDRLKQILDIFAPSLSLTNVWLPASFLYERLMKTYFNKDYFSDKYIDEFAPDELKQKLNKDLIKLLTNKSIKYKNMTKKDKIISIDSFCQLFKLEKHELSGKYVYLGKIILVFDFGYNSVTIVVNNF